MNTTSKSSSEIEWESAVAEFLQGKASRAGATNGEVLLPEGWKDAEWHEFFRHTVGHRVASGEALIRRGDTDSTLYFVLRGTLEVVVHTGDEHCMAPLIRVGAGSVLGEQAFFDDEPRSASVWAVGECELAAMTPEQFRSLEQVQPRLARDLLFALGRVLAVRLRRTTAKINC